MMRPRDSKSLVLLAVMAATACAQSNPRRTPIVVAIEKAAPAVANISTERIVLERAIDPFWSFRRRFFDGMFDDFFGEYRRQKREQPLGSGVVIDEDGYIVTNEHVVGRASNLKVVMANQQTYDAELVSANPAADLAVIKIRAARKFPYMKMGTSSDLMVGETVIAIGNPFGYENSVTTGVLSATKREIAIRGEHGTIKYDGLLQTTALINPGNSGGPLINVLAELIGINTAIRADAQGIGFAIPIDAVREKLGDLFDFRKIASIWIGIDIDRQTKARGGLRVKDVPAAGPAARTGVRSGDVITGVDGHPTPDLFEYARRLVKKGAGDRATLTVQREGRSRAFVVTVEAVPKPSERELARKMMGVSAQNLTPLLARQLRLPIRSGVLVAGVERGSPAHRVGMKRDDIIVAVGDYRLRNVNELGMLLQQLDSGDVIVVIIVRGYEKRWARIKVR